MKRSNIAEFGSETEVAIPDSAISFVRKGIAAERNPQGHASCSANLADILTSSIS